MASILFVLAIVSVGGSAWLYFISEGPWRCKTRLMGAKSKMHRQLRHCQKYVHDRTTRREQVYGRKRAESDEFYTPVKGDDEVEETPDHLPPGAPRMTGELVPAWERSGVGGCPATSTTRSSEVPVALSPEVPVVESSDIEPDLPDHIELPDTE